MMPLLAEAAFELTTEKITGFVVVSSAFSFLWVRFQKSFKRLEERVDTLERVTGNNSQFIAGVATASMAGPTVSSSLIHDLHEQYKPSDGSGIHRPIPRSGKNG
jgi:hypothetical protein